MGLLLVAILASLAVLLPLSSPTAQAAVDPCGAAGNAIACENSKPGSPASEWDIDGSGDASIQGFATDISVNVGNRVDFKIKTPARAYAIDIYRTGYYGGAGARKITSITPSAALPQTQPACITQAATELYDCGNWAVSASWNVPTTAVSGVYIAKLTRTDNADTSHITFVVRDDASTSDVMFQTSDPTWQAYNSYGGANFYSGGPNGRAYKLSYNRPVSTRGVVSGRDFYFSAEYAMVRFMERNGYDVTYTSGVDTDRRGALIKKHKVFLSVGHDEYWSAGQRASVEAARAAGVNMMFLSGNEAYWHTRYESSADASSTAYRTLVSYKETWDDAKIDPSSEWTGTWRDPRFAPKSAGAGLPENSVSGTQYMVNNSDLAVTVSALEGKLRLWRYTSLANLSSGSQTLAAHTIGYESNEDVDNGSRPPGLVDLSTTTGAVAQYLQDFGSQVAPGTTTHHVTLYRAASGALVFSAGSIQWTWGLDANHDGNGAPADVRMQQAQVNLFADMGAQPVNLMAGLVVATKSTDTAGPSTVITSPSGGTTVANGSTVQVTGTASDAAGRVAGAEVSTDGGTTWHPASGTTTWSYSYVQHGTGQVPLMARAIDDSANIGAAATIQRTVTCPCTVYGSAQPAKADSGDTSGVELGLRFTPSVDGYVSGVRFFKSTANTGTHVGTLWSGSGQQLARANFSGETGSGWQSVSFGSVVPVSAGVTYVVSYTAPNGHYAAANDSLWAAGIDAPPLSVAGGFGSAPAGVYSSPATFPSDSYHRGQYYVDPVFTQVDSSPLTVTAQSPLAGSTSVPPSSTVQATFSRAISTGSLHVSVKDANGAAVSGATTYDAASRKATFTPSAPLEGFVRYSVAVDATDTTGQNVSSGNTWSFTTAKPAPAAGVCPCSLYDDSTTPAILQVADSAAVTLGVKFTPSVNGTVTGVRFYKGPGNTGQHTGTLWSAAGSQLATATFSGESASGWQTVTFAQPVTVTANTTYVASYRTQVGNYSATPEGLGAVTNRPPLSTPANAGVYSYGTGFPNGTSSTSYLVDVVFERGASTVAVAGQSPAPGAVDVSRDDPVKVWFTDPVTSAGTLTASVAGSAVTGSTNLSADGLTLTFTPAARLPAGAVVSVSLQGVRSVAGASLANQSWSFTTTSSTAVAPETLFGAVTPTNASVNDSSPVEVGVSFSPTVDGKVTAIRFFKGAGNGGTHRGTLWNAAGQPLATVTFSNETASGWQSATLSTPVNVTEGTSYVVSYLAPQGHYASSPQFFSSAWTSGNLSAPSARNGRYLYGATGGFPTNDYAASNYFVDVAFVANSPSLTVVDRTPADGASNVDRAASISISFSKPIKAGFTMAVRNGTDPVPGTNTLSADATTVSFAPSSPLASDTVFTVSVGNVVSTQDVTLPDQSWSFRTAASTAESMFVGQVPKTLSTNDGASIEVGVAFSPAVNGQVTSVRFYKGSGNTGTHVGTLWTANGTQLGSVTFTNETARGWQSAQLATPIAVVAGQTYVVSYLAPTGHYASTPNFFGTTWTAGSLSAPAANNGRYSYGTGGFPTNEYRRTNYFVDVGFVPST